MIMELTLDQRLLEAVKEEVRQQALLEKLWDRMYGECHRWYRDQFNDDQEHWTDEA